VTRAVPSLRIAADAVCAALGVNLWVCLVLVPGLVAGAFTRHPALAVMAPLPLAVLGVGVARRSPVWLLLAYPAVLLLPVAADPRIAAEGNTGALPVIIAALSLVGFLFGGAYLTSWAAVQPPAGRRRLASSVVASQPARWQRRRRLYIALTVLTAIFPAALLYKATFDRDTRAYLVELYPGARAADMVAVLDLGVVVLWLALLGFAFVGPLRHHRTGDRELMAELDRLRRDARHGAPRLSFYVGVVVALALMAVLVYMRMNG
jgi:hypothetical protein